MWAMLLAFVCILMGCSDSADEGPACAQRVGSYRVHLTEQSGTCGPVVDSVVTLSHQPTTAELPSMGCTGTIRYTADNCTVTTDIRCAVQGGYEDSWGTVRWSADGRIGSGTMGLKRLTVDKTVLCMSMYRYDASWL